MAEATSCCDTNYPAMMQRMLLVTDGEPVHILMLRLFLESMKSQSSCMLQRWAPIIFYPDQTPFSELRDISRLGSIEFRPGTLEFPDDRYASKFMISDFILSDSTSDAYLYLDADHICYSDFQLPPLSESGIWTSSEVNPLSELPNLALSLAEYALLLGGKHHNASLIYGSATRLKQIIPRWHELYSELQVYIPTRFREELAFCLAVRGLGLDLLPIRPEIQSNWSVVSPDTALFHYGGDSEFARTCKHIILHAQNSQSKHVRRRVHILASIIGAASKLLPTN